MNILSGVSICVFSFLDEWLSGELMGSSSVQKLSLWALAALVVSSMLDAGIFTFPATFARATGVLGAIIAWCIAGGGMLMIALVFQRLAVCRPDLDAGIFSYAKDGFGTYVGFLSAFAFWAGSCVGNVAYFILVKATLGEFFPAFGDGNTIVAVVVASVLLWSLHFFILRGITGAAMINSIATTAKILIVVIFLAFIIAYFQPDLFMANFWREGSERALGNLVGLDDYGFKGHAAAVMDATGDKSLFLQVRHIMLVTVYVFVGIEGASIYSRYAKDRRHVGLATILGFLGVLFLFVMVTILSYGVLDRAELAGLRQPSMAGVLQSVIGRGGAIFVSVGLLVSILGAYLAWVLFAAEILFSAARNGAMPTFLGRENKAGVPSSALWMTNILVQCFLLLTVFSDYAYGSALELTSALCLVPYLLVTFYAFRFFRRGENYPGSRLRRKKDFTVALIAMIYAAVMLSAGGLKYLFLSALIYPTFSK